MLQKSRTATHAELISSLNTIDDSSDEDMAEFEQRLTFSRSQGIKSNDATPLGTTLASGKPSQPCDVGQGVQPTSVPKQQGSYIPQSTKHRTKFPTLHGQRDMANSRPYGSFPATATQAKRPLEVDSSVGQIEIKKRKIERDEKTHPETKKQRLDVANSAKGHSRVAGKLTGGSVQGSIKEVDIIDVDALSDQENGFLTRESASSGSTSSQMAITLPLAKGSTSSAISIPHQSSIRANSTSNLHSKDAGVVAAPNLVGQVKNAAPAPLPKPKKVTQKELARIKKELKDCESKMTHGQYIETLPQKHPNREVTHLQYFAGTVILFAAFMTEIKEATRDKLSKLYQHGATILTTYDEGRLTHIITGGWSHETRKAVDAFLKHFKPASRIPLRIKILSWDWVADCLRASRCVEPGKDRYIHTDRWEKEQVLLGKPLPPPRIQKKPRDDPVDTEDEDERPLLAAKQSKHDKLKQGLIKTKSQSPPRPSSPSPDKDDPLAEFYFAGRSDEEDSENERQATRWKSFRCMQKGKASKEVCPNQDVIDKIHILRKLHAVRPNDEEHWKAITLMKAIGSIRSHPKRFESLEETMAIPGIGKRTGLKIMEIINTGELKRIDYERTEQTIVSEIFRDIYGVGPQLAMRWYSLGLRTLDDVRKEKFGIKLTSAQKIGLQHYDDLRTRMPREEAKAIYDKVARIALSLDPKLLIELMGSYRRGNKTCGDIDILITRNTKDGFDHSGILPRILAKLHASGIVVGDLGGESGEDLEAKYMGICRLSPSDRVRRIDILCIPYEQWGGALVYFTGDDIFNRSMRLLANKKGMSLNQRGLWDGVIRDPKTRLKTCAGKHVDRIENRERNLR